MHYGSFQHRLCVFCGLCSHRSFRTPSFVRWVSWFPSSGFNYDPRPRQECGGGFSGDLCALTVVCLTATLNQIQTSSLSTLSSRRNRLIARESSLHSKDVFELKYKTSKCFAASTQMSLTRKSMFCSNRGVCLALNVWIQ